MNIRINEAMMVAVFILAVLAWNIFDSYNRRIEAQSCIHLKAVAIAASQPEPSCKN